MDKKLEIDALFVVHFGIPWRGCVQRMTLAVRQETDVERLRALNVSVWEEEVRYNNSYVYVVAMNFPKQSIAIDIIDVVISLHVEIHMSMEFFQLPLECPNLPLKFLLHGTRCVRCKARSALSWASRISKN